MPDYKARLESRYRKERLFLFLGRASVAASAIILLVLLGSLMSTAWKPLTHTHIAIDVKLPDNGKGYSAAIKSALGESDPQVLKQILSMLSLTKAEELKSYTDKHPEQIGSVVRIWFSASPLADRWYKNDDDSKLTQAQKTWLHKAKSSGMIERKFNLSFFTEADSREPDLAGIMGSVIGSVMTVFACLLLALPLGVMSAIYLQEFAPQNKLTDFIEININNLAAVPSIIFGLLGLSVYINLLGMPRSSALAGGFTLALMVLPTIVIATRTALRSVPQAVRDAALALGATNFQVVQHHVLPLATPGIMTGTILSIARAIGETAPLLMIGMVAFMADIPQKISDPATVMPVQIYLWADSPEPEFIDKTALAILVLLLFLAVINLGAATIRRKFEKRW